MKNIEHNLCLEMETLSFLKGEGQPSREIGRVAGLRERLVIDIDDVDEVRSSVCARIQRRCRVTVTPMREYLPDQYADYCLAAVRSIRANITELADGSSSPGAQRETTLIVENFTIGEGGRG